MANRIHPTAIIGEGVELGDDNVIGPFTVIVGPCRIGNGNWIAPSVSIGTPAEYRGGPHPVGWEGELAGAGVVIGDKSVIREFVTINQGTKEPTRLGDDCFMLARSHLGHDCNVDDGVTLAPNVQLGGHTRVWSWATIGMGTVVHQHGNIGPGAMVGMGSAVRKPVPPFTVAVGSPSRVSGPNRIGLSRRGCTDEMIEALDRYRMGTGERPTDLPVEIAKVLTEWEQHAAGA